MEGDMSDAQDGAGQGIDDMLGLHFRDVTVGGLKPQKLTLRPLTVGQQRAHLKHKWEDDLQSDTAAIHMAAQRGGYTGTMDELEGLLEGDDRIRCLSALEEMVPLTQRRLEEQRAQALEQQANGMEVARAVLQSLMQQQQPQEPADEPAETSGD
jgi:hypothetical protein